MSSVLDKKRFLLENYELVWSKEDIKRFREAWNEEMSIREMMLYMKTSEVEIILLGIDQFGVKRLKERLLRDEGANHIWRMD